MVDASEALMRIESYYEAFRKGIERCRMAEAFDAADWQDAYSRLSRLRDRYLAEKNSLTTSERQALAKVFEQDTFTEGMMDIRHVGEHVTKRTNVLIRTPSNEPIALDVNSSAMAVFAGSSVSLTLTDGSPFRLDHLQWLEEMEKRVGAAFARAKH